MKKRTHVLYRLEDKYGDGAFSTRVGCKAHETQNKTILPTPHAEFLPFVRGRHRCATRSIQKLKQWFDFEIASSSRVLYIRCFEVSECVDGAEQTIYEEQHVLGNIYCEPLMDFLFKHKTL